jgi:hypothetical protein
MTHDIQTAPAIVEAEIAGFKVLQNGEGRIVLAVSPEHLRQAAAIGCAMGQKVAVAVLDSGRD